MWRTRASNQSRQIIKFARRQLSESAPPKPHSSPVEPPRKTGGFGIFKFLGLSLPAATGGLLAYAYYDVDFRKQLEENIPYAKEAFEHILPQIEPEEPPHETSAALGKATMLNVQEKAALQPVAEMKGGSVPVTPDTKTTQQAESKPEATAVVTEKKVDLQTVETRLQEKEDTEKADNAALEVAIHKLLSNSESLTEETVRAQQDLAASVHNHIKLLKQAMDDTSNILQKDAQWEAVAIAFKEREHAQMRASELTSESKRVIERLRDVLADSKKNQVTKNNPAIYPASKKMNELLKDLGMANAKVRQAEAEANVMSKYKDLVEKGKKQFQREIESLLPDVKVGSGKKKLTEDELNALIAHAHRRIEQLQKQVAEQVSLEKQRLSTALEAQRHEDLKLTNAALSDERQQLSEEFEVEKQKLEMEFLVKLESEVRKQLSRQAAAHSDHIKDVLTIQQEQLSQEFGREMNYKLLEEREKFQSEMAGWISRLKGIEAAVEARAESEKIARDAQDLWLACIALNSVIHYGSEEEESKAAIPLRAKVETILNSGRKHPFVETVANAIPVEALDNGVSTEDELRVRFFRVNKICRRLGLVQDGHTSLYKFIISYLHSFVVFDSVAAKSENDVVDLNSFDNFDLLAHAKYWMERGNFEMAVRFMNQLSGEARRAASDWIKDARTLLETKQSAYTLTAYASATGLANTF